MVTALDTLRSIDLAIDFADFDANEKIKMIKHELAKFYEENPQLSAMSDGKDVVTGDEHELKIWHEYFDDVNLDRKPFEIRKADRDFKVGDTLRLREFELGGDGMTDYDLTRHYTGRETKKKITYVMSGGQWGLAEGNCILGIKPLPGEGEWEKVGNVKELAEVKALDAAINNWVNGDTIQIKDIQMLFWDIIDPINTLIRKSLPTSGMPEGMKERLDRARIIGLINGAIEGLEMFGKEVRIEGVINVLIEIKVILSSEGETQKKTGAPSGYTK